MSTPLSVIQVKALRQSFSNPQPRDETGTMALYFAPSFIGRNGTPNGGIHVRGIQVSLGQSETTNPWRTANVRLFKQENGNWLLQYDLASHWRGGPTLDSATSFSTVAELIAIAESFGIIGAEEVTLDEDSRLCLEAAVRRAVADALRKDAKFAAEASRLMPAPSASKVMPSAPGERATATVGKR